ncbi:hypothetical protein [Streptomyces sp. NPDC002265]|uniref:hypothetical protein n=1 Tax=Streptomyces sp. NPDC002265 TaxID=3154415 RepID=UPI003333C781
MPRSGTATSREGQNPCPSGRGACQTGISLSYQICNLVFGGFAPVAAVWLASLAGGAYWPPAVALMAVSVIGIWCTLRLRTYHRRRAVAATTTAERTPVPAGA